MSRKEKIGVMVGVDMDIMPSIERMTDAQIGEMFLAILDYGQYGKEPEFSDNGLYFAWDFIKQSIRDVHEDPGDQADRRSGRYARWRKSVYERDNYTCRMCGKHGEELNAHHIKPWIKYPEFRFDIDNGITLCRKCHTKIHSKKSKCEE